MVKRRGPPLSWSVVLVILLYFASFWKKLVELGAASRYYVFFLFLFSTDALVLEATCAVECDMHGINGKLWNNRLRP